MDLQNYLNYLAAFVFVLGLIGAGAWIMKRFLLREGGFFQGEEKRLSIVYALNLDPRHRLVLIRRDDVEHLLLLGGPNALVIETDIPSSNDNKILSVHEASDAI